MVEPSVRTEGFEELDIKLRRFPRQLKRAVEQAGKEFAAEIIGSEGLQNYPPEDEANQPPVPYYKRGVGAEYAGGNDLSSERYATKFVVQAQGYRTMAGNTASYAEHLGGEEQAIKMGERGWRKLIDVAREKLAEGRKIYVGWINRALRAAGLK